jgi:hypothetical protein
MCKYYDGIKVNSVTKAVNAYKLLRIHMFYFEHTKSGSMRCLYILKLSVLNCALARKFL